MDRTARFRVLAEEGRFRLKVMARILLGLGILGLAGWAALAAWFGPFASPWMAIGLAVVGLFAAGSLAIGHRRGWAMTALFGLAFSGFCLAWSTVEPSNERTWQPDVARLPWAEIDGDFVTLHEIRNFEYRTETDYTPRYYDKTFDLRELDEVDLISVYWMGPAIAHVMLGFGFGGRDYVTISIETRKEVGESYDTIRGFFRQYELIYVVGDDRDLIRLRTNYRKNPVEDVYLFRVAGRPGAARRLFLDYLREINELRHQPKFYNTGTTNCTTNVYRHTRVNPGGIDFSWKLLLSGHAAEYVYETGGLDTSMPFEVLRERSHVNRVAQEADRAADFSQRIRAGLPRPPDRPPLP